MSKQNQFFIISATISKKIRLSEKTHSLEKKMFYTGTCGKGNALFSTDKTQAYPFLKESAAETMLKCLNEPSGNILTVGNDYGILRQATDEK